MKNKILFGIFLLMLLVSRTSIVLAEGDSYEPDLLVDTSKLEGYTFYDFFYYRTFKCIDYDEIRDMYFGPFDEYDNDYDNYESNVKRTVGESFTFQNSIQISYRIQDNRLFNKYLPECEFYYQANSMNKERVIAKYKGKIFRIYDFNTLLNELGKSNIPEHEKMNLVAQWQFWVYNQDVKLTNLDTIHFNYPGKKIILSRSGGERISKGPYEITYEGNIELQGELYPFSVRLLGLDKEIDEFNISKSPPLPQATWFFYTNFYKLEYIERMRSSR